MWDTIAGVDKSKKEYLALFLFRLPEPAKRCAFRIEENDSIQRNYIAL
jgi:hypothetical protein